MAEKAAGGTEPPKYTADAVSATEMALAKLSSGRSGVGGEKGGDGGSGGGDGGRGGRALSMA